MMLHILCTCDYTALSNTISISNNLVIFFRFGRDHIRQPVQGPGPQLGLQLLRQDLERAAPHQGPHRGASHHHRRLLLQPVWTPLQDQGKPPGPQNTPAFGEELNPDMAQNPA